MLTADTIVYCFPINPMFGWGTVGLNFALSWSGTALCAMPDMRGLLAAGDPRMPHLEERIGQSRKFQNDLLAQAALNLLADHPVIVAMGNDLVHYPAANGKMLTGKPTIAWPVFEDEAAVRRKVEALRRYDLVLSASTWNRDILRNCGIDAKLALQGVDMAIFNPTVRRKRSDGRFRVFSGGKCELRKGQDLVIQAFARFAERHDDAVLVACWGSPWAGLAMDFYGSAVGAPPGADIGLPNFAAWAQQNGIKPHQIEIVAPTPNCLMPAVYGGCDVGLFASRAEGATNLMAMECLSCGLPTVVTECTGHRDLPSAAWCEPEVEDIISALDAAANSQNGWLLPDMSEWDWSLRLDEMKRLIEDA